MKTLSYVLGQFPSPYGAYYFSILPSGALINKGPRQCFADKKLL